MGILENNYTVEKNTQMLIYLLKKYGIKKIIASPGTTNITFVYSCQQDSYFEVYSAPDERSAAYMACGMSIEANEPVVISCTGATASRNYLPGLTEAFYRRIPILAVTSTQPRERYGNLAPQFIDRTQIPRDCIEESFYLPSIHCHEDELDSVVNINRALIELTIKSKRPIHINLETEYKRDYSVKKLPSTRMINLIKQDDECPVIYKYEKIGIYVGAHSKWNEELIRLVDCFCEQYNAVVLCDQTSNYTGKYAVFASLLTYQEKAEDWRDFDLLIDIGEVSGAYMRLAPKEVWRISDKGEVEDRFRKLTHVFFMREERFFEKYNCHVFKKNTTFYDKMHGAYMRLLNKMESIPFSNIYVASRLFNKIPTNSIMHFGILNSLRSWNFFETRTLGYANTGGFGIDGCMSTFIGASLVDEKKIYYLVIGDLAFFYDMNSLGNRHVGKNLRIMVISNGCGTEFKNYDNIAYRFGDKANAYIAAEGHYGNKSHDLIRNYAEALGFKYISAENEEEFDNNIGTFISEDIEQSVVFEIFTEANEESNALRTIRTINGRGVYKYSLYDKSFVVERSLGDIIEVAFILEAKSILWQYKYPKEEKWKGFVNGKTGILKRKIENNYDNLRIRAVYIDENGHKKSSGEIVVVLK